MLKERPLPRLLYQQLQRAGLGQIMASLMARRATDLPQCKRLLQLSLRSLTHPLLLQEMTTAVLRVVQAIEQGEIIAIQTDYDCDGQTAHAVIYQALVEIFQHDRAKTLSFIGNRHTAGYGFNVQLAEQIIAQKATLVITADNGSSDIATLRMLAEHGIDVIVTDHHTVSVRPPHLYAFLNPAFANHQFADSAIAGCMTAWLFMAAIYLHFRKNKRRSLTYSVTRLLDYVAIGTLADCVSLLSHNNRIVVRYGLRLMNQADKPIWQVLKQHLKQKGFTRETIQFYVAPLLNAASRVGDAYTSLAFLLADNTAEATQSLTTLQRYNLARRVLQQQVMAEVQRKLALEKPSGLIFFVLVTSHAGINGIIASKITAQTGQTTVILSIDAQGKVTGSLRTTKGLNLVRVLQLVDQQVPQLLLNFGGHQRAAGVSLLQESLPLFQSKLTAILQDQAEESVALWHDGSLPAEPLAEVMQQLQRLEPFGVDFPVPVFCDQVTLLTVERFGSLRQYLSLRVQTSHHCFKGVFFSAAEHAWTFTLQQHDQIQMMYTLSHDQYNHEPVGVIEAIIFGAKQTW